MFKVAQNLVIMERTVPSHGMKIVNLVLVISNLEHAKVILRELRVNNAIKVINRTLRGVQFLIVKYDEDRMNNLYFDTYIYLFIYI